MGQIHFKTLLKGFQLEQATRQILLLFPPNISSFNDGSKTLVVHYHVTTGGKSLYILRRCDTNHHTRILLLRLVFSISIGKSATLLSSLPPPQFYY